MAKNNGNVWNKFLNMIGIVDAEQQEQQYNVYQPRGNGMRQGQYGQRPQQQNPYRNAAPRGGYQPYSDNGRGYGADRRQPYRGENGNGYSSSHRQAPQQRSAGYRQQQDGMNRDDNVVPFNQPIQAPKTVFYCMHRLDECTSVINDLIRGKTVLINLEELESPYLQRAVDTLSGAAFAISATMQKASDRAYLISPTKIEIGTGDARRTYQR